MKRISLYILGLVSLFFLAPSCEDMLKVEPRHAITIDVAVEDYAGLEALLLGAYQRFQSEGYYGKDMIVNPEILADNCEYGESSGRLIGEYNNTPGNHVNIWGSAYSTLNRINLVIESCALSSATDEEKAKVKAEALFLRALVHFDLARIYGRELNHINGGINLAVPIATSSFNGLDADAYPSRSTIEEVYNFVIADIQEALANLPATISNQGRASKAAAYALLSRVYLYKEDWSNAIANADLALAAANLSVVNATDAITYESIFSAGAETIFEISIPSSESLSTNSIAYIYIKDGGYGDAAINQYFVPLFQANDIRSSLIVAFSGRYYTYKFNSHNGTAGADDVPIFRVSELYLNKAEAYMELGQTDNAVASVNEVRTKRGLEAYTSATPDLLNAILLERRLELAFEGHRFFDLKRKGLDIPKPRPGEENKILQNSDYRVVAKIPTSDMDINPNLVQNPNY